MLQFRTILNNHRDLGGHHAMLCKATFIYPMSRATYPSSECKPIHSVGVNLAAPPLPPKKTSMGRGEMGGKRHLEAKTKEKN